MIFCLAAIFQNNTTKPYLCNNTQAYIKLTSNLSRDFFICPFSKLITMIEVSSNYILKVLKPLYSISKASNHWFVIYYNNHINDFFMTELNYNFYLFYRYKSFSIVCLQTNNTLMLVNNTFATIKEEVIKTVKFMTKK